MPEDSDPDRGLVSVASPIGRAFVGKEEGDEVDGADTGWRPHVRDLSARHDPRRRIDVTDSSYSPRLRTGVILCGTGTAGAYQAGVLRALTEAGVKIDVVAAHGAGVMTALCAAIDGDRAAVGSAGAVDRPAACAAPIAGGRRCASPATAARGHGRC